MKQGVMCASQNKNLPVDGTCVRHSCVWVGSECRCFGTMVCDRHRIYEKIVRAEGLNKVVTSEKLWF